MSRASRRVRSCFALPDSGMRDLPDKKGTILVCCHNCKYGDVDEGVQCHFSPPVGKRRGSCGRDGMDGQRNDKYPEDWIWPSVDHYDWCSGFSLHSSCRTEKCPKPVLVYRGTVQQELSYCGGKEEMT